MKEIDLFECLTDAQRKRSRLRGIIAAKIENVFYEFHKRWQQWFL